MASLRDTQPSDLSCPWAPLDHTPAKVHRGGAGSHTGTLAFPCLLLFSWACSSNVLPFLFKTGAESALNHKTAQRGSWQLQAMSVPLDPNPWSLRPCKEPGKGSRWASKAQIPGEGASHTLRAPPWGVTWLYQQGPLLYLFVTLRSSTDNSALGAFAGYQVPPASPLLL